ncbi:hypothetical protein [Paenibacillus pini]|uniref:Uncharacterized protein n=1 Tax=Paenibacillus pini JCM 16418 TaxID=1236976 RepID=W7Z0G5_9BACL|nr:hypothetical protein [Paenibacillus pini]GAF10446.1 hypothetical protein JCM16418_4652 [Paenibacillus pini JCM 16418]
MRTYIANGWKSVKDQFYVIIILFLYQLLWGYFLYRLVESAVVPLLMRYPDPPPNQLSQALYYIEAQMGLSENSTVHAYLWILLGIGVFRMLLTPFIQAGILYGLQQEYKGLRGLFFFQGMRRYGKSIFIFHIVEWILLAAPAYWLLPRLYHVLISGLQSQLLFLNGVPYVVAWLLYGYIVHQLLLYMQFGKISGSGMVSSLWIGICNSLPIIGISICLE